MGCFFAFSRHKGPPKAVCVTAVNVVAVVWLLLGLIWVSLATSQWLGVIHFQPLLFIFPESLPCTFYY